MAKAEVVETQPMRRKVITTQEQLVPAGEEATQETKPSSTSFYTLAEFMHTVSDRGWEKSLVYLYRRRPEDPPHRLGPNIEKLTVPVSEDEVRQKWGGGCFRVLANSGGTVYARCDFELEGAPKYAEGSVQGPQGLEGLMTRMFDKFSELKNQGVDPKQAVQASMDILSEAYKTAAQNLATKGTDLDSAVNAVVNLRKLSDDNGGSGGGISSLMEKFLLMGFEKLFTPVDPIAQIKAYGEVLRDLRGGGSEGGVVPTNNWKAALANNMPEVLRTAKEMLAEAVKISDNNRIVALAAQAQPSAPHRAPSPAASPAVPANARALPAAAAPAAPSPAVAWETETLTPLNEGAIATGPVADAPTPGDAAAAAFANQVDQVVKTKIVHFIQQGFEGQDIGVWIDMEVPQFFKLFEKASVDDVLRYFAKDPILGQLPQDARLRKVVEEFLEFAKEAPAPAA